MRARFLIGTFVGVAVLLIVATMSATPAEAEERPGGNGGAYVDPDGDPTAVAGDGGSGSGSSGGSADTNPCEWHVVIDDDVAFPVYDVDSPERQHSATGRWLEYRCEGRGAVAVDGWFLIPEGGLVDPRQLAVDALASVSIPAPVVRTSPAADGRLFVQVPTWLWLERSWWQPYEATARAGRVWSTVRAIPVASTWSVGDGRTVSCRGPGSEWQPGAREDAASCTHIYRVSSAGSAGGTFKLEATVTFEVSWSSNASDGGALPAITRTSTVDVEVGEIQAIGTGGGR